MHILQPPHFSNTCCFACGRTQHEGGPEESKATTRQVLWSFTSKSYQRPL